MSTSGPDMSLDFVPSAQDVPRLSAAPRGPGNPSVTGTTMRGLLPWPMSQFDSIPVYSLCYASGSRGAQGQSIQPLPCPVMSHFSPRAPRSKPTSLSLSIPNPPTTASHASSLDICTSRACRDLAQFANLNSQALGKYPSLVDQGTRAAAAGGARDACALASCPHAYHAFTATVCVPLSHPELKKRGATLDRAPAGARPDLAALLEARIKAPDRDVAPGLGVCLSAMPLGSSCNPDVVVINPPPSLDSPLPQQGNGTLNANRLPAAFLPPAWSTDADLFPASDLVSGAFIEGQLFVSSLWPLPRAPTSSLPPQRATPPNHPIWSPVYSLTTCAANKTTVEAQMPGEPCMSTAECAMSPCVDPLNNYPIVPGGSIAGQCSRLWMSKANVTVSEQEYSKALDAAQSWETTVTWITIGLMFPAFLFFMFASMCGTEHVWKRCRERRRQAKAAANEARSSKQSPKDKDKNKNKNKNKNRDKAADEPDVELCEQGHSSMSALDRAHFEHLRVLQEMSLYMRGVDSQTACASSAPSASHARQCTDRSARPASGSAAVPDPPNPTAPPQPVLVPASTTPQSTNGSFPRPHILPRISPPSTAATQGLSLPALATANAQHIPRPRFAAPAVTTGVPSRPVIPPRLQNASIPVNGGARPSAASAATHRPS